MHSELAKQFNWPGAQYWKQLSNVYTIVTLKRKFLQILHDLGHPLNAVCFSETATRETRESDIGVIPRQLNNKCPGAHLRF